MRNTPLRTSSAVRATVSDDGLLLLDVDGGLVLSSNQIGARIWQLIEQQRTGVEIAHQIADDYDISAARAGTDVDAFVSALIARGLVIEEPR